MPNERIRLSWRDFSGTLRREFSAIPTRFHIILFGGGVLLLTPLANKLLVELLGFLSVFFLLMGLIKAKANHWLCWWITILLWSIALIIPVDIAIRSAPSATIRWVSVGYGYGTYSSMLVRRLEAKGRVRNQDFVVYHPGYLLEPAHRAILITLPTKWPINTPLYSFFNEP